MKISFQTNVKPQACSPFVTKGNKSILGSHSRPTPVVIRSQRGKEEVAFSLWDTI